MTDLPASGSDGGGDRCLTCLRPHLGSSTLCERCSPPTRSDITSLLPLRLFLTFCDICLCYLQPPGTHVTAAPKSRKLLDHCIYLIWRLLPRPRPILLDAEFAESCESSDRLIVKLRLSGEIAHWYHHTEFTVRHKVCKFCYFSFSFTMPRFTGVLLRQDHVQLSNTLFFLGKAMSEHGVTCRALKIHEHVGGTDYWFSDRTHALDLVQFIEGVASVKKQSDDDGVSATFFSLHILPICRDDMILGSTVGLGDNFDFVICTGVAVHGISLIDPFTLQTAFLTAEDYWRAPCPVIQFDRRILVKYLVLDIITVTTDPPVADDDDSYCLAHAHIVRVSDLGKTDDRNKLMVRTHLGRLLKPGDYVLGYAVGGPAKVILVKKGCQWMKRKSVVEPSSQEPRSVDTALDGIRKDEYEELSREMDQLELINSSPRQISKESQMLPTPSDDVPSNPEGKWLGDVAAADNTTMEWLPSTQLSSPQQMHGQQNGIGDIQQQQQRILLNKQQQQQRLVLNMQKIGTGGRPGFGHGGGGFGAGPASSSLE